MFTFTEKDSSDGQGFVDLDPRMGSFVLWTHVTDVDSSGTVTGEQKLLSVDRFSPENFPELYDSGVVPAWLS